MMRKELRQKEEQKIKRSMRWKFLERDGESFSQLYHYTIRLKPPKKKHSHIIPTHNGKLVHFDQATTYNCE